MTDAATKLPVKTDEKSVQAPGTFWSPFGALRSEIDRLFDDLLPSSLRSFDRPLLDRAASMPGWATAPAVDVIEKDGTYELSAEVPGLDEKNLEVRISNGFITIRGEKQDERKSEETEYHLSERRYGSFQRSFQLPAGVDAEKINATFSNGVLKVMLPKSAEAKKNERKVEIKAA